MLFFCFVSLGKIWGKWMTLWACVHPLIEGFLRLDRQKVQMSLPNYISPASSTVWLLDCE